MNDPVKVVRVELATADVDQLAWIIGAAFHDLPQSRWLVANPEDRRRILRAWFALDVEWALRYGGAVYTTGGEQGVAVFMPPPEPTTDGLGQPMIDYNARVAAIAGPKHARRFGAFDATLAMHRPTVPHDWLALLAVRSEYRNRGVGTALLGEQARLPTYLEAATPANRLLYLGRGFRDYGDPFALPEDGPAFYPMLRESAASP